MTLAANGAPDQPAPAGAGVDAGATVVLLLFAEARVAAGTGRHDLVARTVGEVLELARGRHGGHFAAVLERCRVWVNGEPALPEQTLHDGDEVAVLPPVSGGVGA